MQATRLKALAEGFERNRMVVARTIREFREKDPQGFLSAAVALLRETPEDPFSKYLLAVLLAQPRGVEIVCDPDFFSVDQSVRLVQQAKTLEPQLEVHLAKLLASSPLASEREANFGTRVMEVLDRSVDPSTTLPAIRQLLQCPNARIRSKAALLMGRISRNPQWAKWSDPLQDQRVSANALESLWGLDTAAARAAFHDAAFGTLDQATGQTLDHAVPRDSADHHNRVVGNGAVGLYLAGDFAGVTAAFRLSRNREPVFRVTGAWVMGRVADPRFLPRLQELAADADGAVRQAAARAIAEITKVEQALKAIATIPLHIRTARWEGAANAAGTHKIELTVADGGRETADLTALQLVVTSGGALVEDFTVSGNQGAEVLHHLAWDGALPESREVKVELYSKRGWGMDVGLEVAVQGVVENTAP